MRILVISDIHANLEGFEACLAAVPKYDLLVNLGDIVGYGGSPNEVTDLSRKTGAIFVRGNHDKACTGITGVEEFNPIAGLAALWTKQTLTPENLEWLRALPQGPVQLENTAKEGEAKALTIQCVHGSPLNEDEYIIVMRDAYEPLMHTEAALTFFGHTHIQGGFCKNCEKSVLQPVYRSRDKRDACEVKLDPDTQYLINPGSVGQPRDSDWRAAFALFDTDAYELTFFRVPYDVQLAQKRILEANLPQRLAQRLAIGR